MTGNGDDEPFVRPFGLTGGRTKPSRSDLDLTTQVMRSMSEQAIREEHHYQLKMSPEMHAIVDLAGHPVAVIEIAGRMAPLPLSTVQITVSDMVDSGLLTIIPTFRSVDIALLERIKDGLKHV